MAHNKQWAQEFVQSKSMLLYATEGWFAEVEHIGSTAVEQLIAQPIIDMVAGIRDLQGLNEAATLVEGLNYSRVAAPEWCESELVALLQKPRGSEPTHRVMIVKHGGSTWERCLRIRDTLNARMDLKESFENVKRDHFQPGCSAEQAYENAKSEFFQSVP